jgi:hypothetical protein
MKRELWQDWVNLVLGIWLFIAPFVGIGAAHDAAIWNSYVCGILVAVFSWAALVRPQRWEEWLNLVVGIWLIIAPFALQFTDRPGAMWNQIIVGVIIGADALLAMRSPAHHHRAV